MNAPLPARLPLTLLTVLTVCVLLYWGRTILIPIALALYLAVLLLPAVELLCRFRLPRMLASACVMLILAALIATLVEVTVPPAREWMDRAPSVFKDIERKLRPLRQAATQIEQVAQHAERITSGPGYGGATPVAPQPATATGTGLLYRMTAMLIPVMGAFFLTFFLLACGPPILKRFAESRANSASSRHTMAIAERARREVSRYLGTLTVINLGLGIVATALAASFNLPNPFLWGVMAAVLNYIPYAGPAVTLIILTLVALLTQDGVAPALGVASIYLLIVTLEGQVIQPLALGRRLALNPLAIFLALWFGAGFWGVAGMMIATPVLLTAKVVCRRIPTCRAFSNFLAPIHEPAITARARKWQRHRYRHGQRAKAIRIRPRRT